MRSSANNLGAIVDNQRGPTPSVTASTSAAHAVVTRDGCGTVGIETNNDFALANVIPTTLSTSGNSQVDNEASISGILADFGNHTLHNDSIGKELMVDVTEHIPTHEALYAKILSVCGISKPS